MSNSERCYNAWYYFIQSVWYYFLYEVECITRFSYPHECTFNCLGATIPKSHLCNLSKNLICFKFCWFVGITLKVLSSSYIFLLLQYHGDIDINPGPQKLKPKSLLVCHWNLNSLSAHNFSTLTQLKAYISMFKHDFICIS